MCLWFAAGNFVVANPIGNVDGVDYGYAGRVRRINTDRINELLAADDVVLISCLGYTATGEVYNCPSEQVAMHAAVQLQAHKLIFLCDEYEVFDTASGGVVHSMPVDVARAFLDDHTALVRRQAAEKQAALDADHSVPIDATMELLVYMDLAIQACNGGECSKRLSTGQQKGVGRGGAAGCADADAGCLSVSVGVCRLQVCSAPT
jgi:amino-acid N-acetyltransferase